MTVEAAVIVPLLLLFFLHLGSCMEMLRLHGRLEYALWQTGRELVVYAAAENDAPDSAVSYLYVNSRVQQILGREYLDASPLIYGSLGLNYLASEYQEDENINIVLTYQVAPPITCFPFPYFRMTSRYYGRAWTGYAVGEDERQKIYVYVTDDGEVWHSRGDCSYLKLSIYEAPPDDVWMLRNTNGECYRACSRCDGYVQGETVYLTREGNRYHCARNCPSLQRRIHAVEWRENMPYRPCSRCSQS
ncbi:MAG: hypothetical protein K2O34_09865 [Acetatifactor sp.]|nr:hypothetical protein [Acetatifactor sp.]